MSEPINAGPSESPEQTTWGVGPWQGEWPADAGTPDEPNPDSLLDPELLLNGDTRNVLDQYRYWKMEAIIASLDQRRHKYHVAIENWQHDLNIGSIVRTANAFLDEELHIIGKLGAAAGVGSAVEFAGSAIERMDVEGRLTLCNLSVELGARFGMVAPDERTFEYLRGRPFAPQGEAFEAAVAHWRTLPGDADATFDREEVIDASAVRPTITWGTSPEHAIPVDGHVPDPADAADATRRDTLNAALDYMGLTAGQAIAGTPIDWVFIGSCANSRVSDLRSAAEVVRGKHVAAGVTAWVVPGSENVKRSAEAEGLREVFETAGFEWREPGCSMCVAANGEQVPPQKRSVSTSNRNFVGRQGPGARTHLASPAMAAAAAIAGVITDLEATP